MKKRTHYITFKDYEVALWAIPFFPLILLYTKIRAARRKHFTWNVARGTKVLTNMLWHEANRVKTGECWYASSWSIISKNAGFGNVAWARKYNRTLSDLLFTTYKYPGFDKIVYYDKNGRLDDCITFVPREVQ